MPPDCEGLDGVIYIDLVSLAILSGCLFPAVWGWFVAFQGGCSAAETLHTVYHVGTLVKPCVWA